MPSHSRNACKAAGQPRLSECLRHQSVCWRASAGGHQPFGRDHYPKPGAVALPAVHWRHRVRPARWRRFLQRTRSARQQAFEPRLAMDRRLHVVQDHAVDRVSSAPVQRTRARDFARRPRRDLAINVLYDLPFGRGKQFQLGQNRILNAVLGNWQYNVVTEMMTGSPTPMPTNATAVGNPKLPSGQQTFAHWFDTCTLLSNGQRSGCSSPSAPITFMYVSSQPIADVLYQHAQHPQSLGDPYRHVVIQIVPDSRSRDSRVPGQKLQHHQYAHLPWARRGRDDAALGRPDEAAALRTRYTLDPPAQPQP